MLKSNSFNPLGMLFAMLIGVVLLGVIAPITANAQVLQSGRQLGNSRVITFKDATAAQTFATTSYADLALATVTFTPSVDPNAAPFNGAPNYVDNLRVVFAIDGTKATSTTGSCAVYVNGAILAKTERFISSAAGRGTIAGDFIIPNTTTAAQTVKLQCRSGDSAVFTVNNAHMIVTESW